MYKTGVKLLIIITFFVEVIKTIKGKTWSRGTNFRLPLGVNVNVYLSYMRNLNGRTLKCHLVPVNNLMRVMYQLLQ